MYSSFLKRKLVHETKEVIVGEIGGVSGDLLQISQQEREAKLLLAMYWRLEPSVRRAIFESVEKLADKQRPLLRVVQ